MNEDRNKQIALSAGGALRDKLFNKITPVLLSSEQIADSRVRSMVQSNCHEMVAAVEEFIRQYDLDFVTSGGR